MSRARTTASVEEAVLNIWSEVLGTAEIGAGDDFFALGGQSLQAVQIAARVQEEFGVELPADVFLDTFTVAGMAEAIRSARGKTGPAPSRARRRRDEHPLLLAQEGLWSVSVAYAPDMRPQTYRTFRLAGPVDASALRHAVTEIARRHESLRTVFRVDAGRPRAVVLPEPRVELSVVRVPGGGRGEEHARREARRAADDPFEIWDAPPWRAVLVSIKPDLHLFVLVLHEIVCDGWSFDVLIAELSDLYAGHLDGSPPPAQLPIQPADVADWERSWLSTEEAAAQRAYWDTALAGAPLTFELPFRVTDDESAQRIPQRIASPLPDTVSDALRDLAERENASLFTVYLAAFFVLLARYTGDTDLVVASPTANRTHLDVEGLIGAFMRNLPLRARLDGDPSFLDLLGQVRRTVLDGVRNGLLASDQGALLLREDAPRGLRTDFVGFRLSHSEGSPALGSRLELPGVRAELVSPPPDPPARLALEIVAPPGRTATATLAFDDAQLDAAMSKRILAAYGNIAARCARDPDSPVSELGAAAEDRVSRWSPADMPQPAVGSAHELVERLSSEALAVRGPAGDVSFAELDARANQVAHRLAAEGVGPGTTVGLRLPPSADQLVAMVGVLKTGAACAAPGVADVDVSVDAERVRGALEREPIGSLDAAIEPDAPAFVLSTSGVTGPPRRIVLSHLCLVQAAAGCARAQGVTAADRVFALDGPGVSGWPLAVWPHLASGVTVVVPDGAPHQAASSLLRWLADREATVAVVGARLASELLALEDLGGAGLRLVLVAGPGALDLPPARSRARVAVARQYGIAEAGGVVMSAPVTQRPTSEAPAIGTAKSSRAAVAVLDPWSRPAPIGIPGELCLAEDCIASPDVFVDHAGERWIRTGDLARMREDGTLELVGRRRDELRFRGFRLNWRLEALESCLRSHPGIAAAATAWDAADEAIVAYVVPRRARPPARKDLDHWVKRNMAKWVLPARYVRVEAIPARPDGTTDRSALGGLFGEVVGDVEPPGPAVERAQQALAAIWRDLLGRRRVEANDNFWTLGGDLVLGVEMVARAREAGVPIAAPQVFASPTISELVEEVEGSLDESAVAAPAPSSGRPLSQLVRRWSKR